ncbi:MAG: thiamine diphosphokinase [Clostridiaceae bacterium]|nr:thiamine diphosphokinase [Clostridiaceae bacterium]
MTGLIVCNGEIKDYSYYKSCFEKADLVICTDGAVRHMSRFGIIPHVLLGDFDSITPAEYGYFLEQGVKIKKFPVEKDKTDTELAVEYALEEECNEIILIGAMGTRIDHTLSNIFLLERIVERGARGWIIDEYNKVTLIKNSSITLEKKHDEFVSLLPLHREAGGISTKGLYYPLDNDRLTASTSRGISNEFVENTAQITVKEGWLLIIKSRD